MPKFILWAKSSISNLFSRTIFFMEVNGLLRYSNLPKNSARSITPSCLVSTQLKNLSNSSAVHFIFSACK